MSKETHHIHGVFTVHMCFDIEANSPQEAQLYIGNELKEMHLAAHQQFENKEDVVFVVPVGAHINDVEITVSVEDDEAEEETSEEPNDKRTMH